MYIIKKKTSVNKQSLYGYNVLCPQSSSSKVLMSVASISVEMDT